MLSLACRPSAPSAPVTRLASPPERPQLMFVSVVSGETFHRVGVARVDRPAEGAFVTDLECERVYFAGQRGICLTSQVAESGSTEHVAEIFDERFERVHRMRLTGAPSRVRVSPDGRLAAATVFESGHSYAAAGFSTRTTIYDLTAGRFVGDLEQFETRRNGQVVREVDFNFWGVTFARDSDTFYATLATAGASHLVRGSVRTKSMEIVHADVECPSLSPDNTRIAFKKQIGARSLGWWQIAVLQLDTMTESRVTGETRSVDDQVEWLDNDHVVYHLTGGSTAADLWTVPVDSSSSPRLLLASAYSPAVVR